MLHRNHRPGLRGLAVIGRHNRLIAVRQLGNGNVQLVFVIDTNGGVTDVTVIESSGHQLLDEAAVAMWSKARFDVSAKLDGQPIRSLAYSTVPFTLP